MNDEISASVSEPVSKVVRELINEREIELGRDAEYFLFLLKLVVIDFTYFHSARGRYSSCFF